MVQKNKNDIPEDLLPNMNFLILRLNLPQTPSANQKILQIFSRFESTYQCLTKADILIQAQTDKLYVNPSSMTEKDKKDKSLMNIPKQASPQILSQAFKNLLENSIKQKRTDRYRFLTQQTEIKTKLEKTQKNKLKDSPELNVLLGPVIQPNSFEEITTLGNFTGILVFSDYPETKEEYLAFWEINNKIDYFVNCQFKSYAKTGKINPDSSTENEGVFQAAMLEKQEVISSFNDTSDFGQAQLFNAMLLKSDFQKDFKKAHFFDFCLNLIEQFPEKPQTDKFLETFLKQLDFLEISKQNYKTWNEKVLKKPIQLNNKKEALFDTSKIICETRNYLLNVSQNHKKVDFSIILSSIDFIFDKSAGFDCKEPNISLTEKKPVQNLLNLFPENNNKIEYKNDVYQANFPQSIYPTNIESAKPDLENRKEISSLLPFFNLTESQLCDKICQIDLDQKFTKMGLKLDQPLFTQNHAEIIHPNLFLNRKTAFSRFFLNKVDFDSQINKSQWQVFFNQITFDFNSSNIWTHPNNLLPHFSVWSQKYASSNPETAPFYDYDFGKIGNIEIESNRVYKSPQEFVSKNCFKIGNYQHGILSLTTPDLNVFISKSPLTTNHYHYYQTSIAFESELISNQNQEIQTTLEYLNKHKKDKKTEIQISNFMPSHFIETSFWKKPETSHLLINYSNTARFFAEIEPFYDLQTTTATRKEDKWFEPTVNQTNLQNQIKFGQSLTSQVNDLIVKVLPSGNILLSNHKKLAIVTKKGHIIVYQKLPTESQTDSSVTILHPTGSTSLFQNQVWQIISKDGKARNFFQNGFSNQHLPRTQKHSFAFTHQASNGQIPLCRFQRRRSAHFTG